MTASAQETAALPDRAHVHDVADTFVQLMRSFGRAKARMLAAAKDDVEWSAQLLLRHLRHDGPMRAGELAEAMHADPSTISRQVATLVRDGLVERQADPQDGRASILVPTAAAGAVLAEHERRRTEFFAGLVADWDAEELDTFVAMLRRFTGAFDAATTTLIDEEGSGRAPLRALEGK